MKKLGVIAVIMALLIAIVMMQRTGSGIQDDESIKAEQKFEKHTLNKDDPHAQTRARVRKQ